ncbi:MAG: HEAT repeat domain-containing protein [Rudaea sp.]|uniref:HEAT repeat domain-containing protein n=1 Tax=Rudaea sp. TaxID=2136325 RepID=UPI0039E42EED
MRKTTSHLLFVIAMLYVGAAWCCCKGENIFAEPGISVATYIERLKTGTTEWQRYNAAAALGELGDRSAIPALVEALKSPSEWVRTNAVQSLDQLGAVEAMPNIKALLLDQSSDVRAAANVVIKDLQALKDKSAN